MLTLGAIADMMALSETGITRKEYQVTVKEEDL